MTETKEEKLKEACEGLAKEPPVLEVPETKAMVGAEDSQAWLESGGLELTE